jgi:hypothetical protein
MVDGFSCTDWKLYRTTQDNAGLGVIESLRIHRKRETIFRPLTDIERVFQIMLADISFFPLPTDRPSYGWTVPVSQIALKDIPHSCIYRRHTHARLLFLLMRSAAFSILINAVSQSGSCGGHEGWEELHPYSFCPRDV